MSARGKHSETPYRDGYKNGLALTWSRAGTLAETRGYKRGERQGIYRLRVTLSLTGALTDAQRQELLAVANKCPVHKLMTVATTEVHTELAPA